MKILYYSSHPSLSLYAPVQGERMREMIAAFRQVGHDVRPVIMGDEDNVLVLPDKKRLAKRTVVKWSIPAVVRDSLKDYALQRRDRLNKKKLAEIIQYEQPDLIYERASYMQLSGLELAKKMGVSHVLEFSEPQFDVYRSVSKVTTPFEKQAQNNEKRQLLMTDQLVVTSQALRDYFVEKHRMSSRRFTVIPNAIDPGKIQPNQKCVNEIRDAYGLRDKCVIGFIGEMSNNQGVAQLIHAVNTLRIENNNLVLLFVGDGDDLNQFKALSKSLEVEDHVIFTGSISDEDVYDYIEVMDISVLPQTKWYDSPVTLFKYGAMGKPVVAFRTWPVREVMTPHQDGILLRDEGDLLPQLDQLIRSPQVRARMAQAFRQKVLREYTWLRNADRALHNVDVITA